MSAWLLAALLCARLCAAGGKAGETAAPGGGNADRETMRDAVASPLSAAAAPGAAFSFFRVPGSLAAPSPRAAAPRPRVPLTSTEWLERRGLLESLSVSEAAASQEAASPPSAATTPASVHSPTAPTGFARFAWGGIAFLAAAFVLRIGFP